MYVDLTPNIGHVFSKEKAFLVISSLRTVFTILDTTIMTLNIRESIVSPRISSCNAQGCQTKDREDARRCRGRVDRGVS